MSSYTSLQSSIDYSQSVQQIHPAFENPYETTVGNGTESLFVPQLVALQSALAPDRIALAQGNDFITYKNLDDKATMLAKHLQLLGVGPNVVVGLFVSRSLAMVVGALAILKAGGA